MSEYMKHNRTPFEVRTDLLKIAQDYLQKQYDANMELYRSVINSNYKAGVALHSDLLTEVPKYFNFEDIISKAKELYGFVNNNK